MHSNALDYTYKDSRSGWLSLCDPHLAVISLLGSNYYNGRVFSGVCQVAQEVKGFIEEFRPFIPLIQGLRNPGMRSRHWEQVQLILFKYCYSFSFIVSQ